MGLTSRQRLVPTGEGPGTECAGCAVSPTLGSQLRGGRLAGSSASVLVQRVSLFFTSVRVVSVSGLPPLRTPVAVNEGPLCLYDPSLSSLPA